MIKKRKKENENQDNGTIIEMAPLKNEKLLKVFVYAAFTFSIASFSILILFLYWFNSNTSNDLIKNKLNEQEIFFKNSNIKLQKEFDIKINNLNNQINEINSITPQINQKSFSNKLNELEKNIKIIEQNLSALEKKKDLFYENNLINKKIKNMTNKESQLQSSDKKQKINKSNKQLENLLKEFEVLKNELFRKKSFGEFKNNDLSNKVMNYLSGFFNLRNFQDNETPRSLLTSAEISASKGDLESVIKYMSKLPSDWKIKAESFIIKSKAFLKNEQSED